MKLIKPRVDFVAGMSSADAIRHIELCGRVAYKSEDKITEDSAERFIRSLIKRGHESVLEHTSVTLRWICDRGVSHELVRHRIASYTQESTRYCDYTDSKHGGELTFIIPPWLDAEEGRYKRIFDNYGGARWHLNGFAFDSNRRIKADGYIFLSVLHNLEMSYKNLLENGYNWTPQQARAILPNALKTDIVFTMNWRELRHMLKLRMAKDAHPQMQEIANMTYDMLSGMGYGVLLGGVK